MNNILHHTALMLMHTYKRNNFLLTGVFCDKNLAQNKSIPNPQLHPRHPYKSNSRASTRTQHLTLCWLREQSSSVMSSSLTICILLIGYLFSSSATSFKTTKLASEESSRTHSLTASPTWSSVTTLNSNITKLANLNGYVIDVTYKTTECNTPIYAYVHALNTCSRQGPSLYSFIVATTSSVTYATFTDSQCTMGIQLVNTKSYVDGVCGYSSSKATFISETSAISTTIATASQR